MPSRALLLLLIACSSAVAAPPPLLDEKVVAAFAQELSGDAAQRNLEAISASHRMNASQGFHEAASFIERRLREYGLEDVEILRFPADGKSMFGPQKSRLGWDVESAELWELAETNGQWQRSARIADWSSMPLSLAQASESGDVTAELVDVGAGTSPADYEGKDVRARLVLVSSQPTDAQVLAIERYGAAGIVSHAQNQRTAWSGDDPNLVRWGHLDSYSKTPTFAFMVSAKQAREWQARLATGQAVRLEAHVRAARRPSEVEIVTARIAGADPRLAAEEVAFSCHLDHPHPGANDNASGCATILEVARTYAKLIREGRLPRPARSVRFIWPPEIEGTTILLNGRPDMARRIVAVLQLDMVGGGPETQAVFRVTRTHASLPTFVNDVAAAFGRFVNEQSLAHASGEDVPYPLVAAGGEKGALLAQLNAPSTGSDHMVYVDSSFAIPAIYLNDWPDRYIHTTGDLPGRIDPTKLERAAFISGASAWYLANLGMPEAPGLIDLVERGQLERTADMLRRRATRAPAEADVLSRFHWQYERGVIASIDRWVPLRPEQRRRLEERIDALADTYGTGGAAPRPTGAGAVVYRRNPALKGPMVDFSYEFVADRLGSERSEALALRSVAGADGGEADYPFEALNFVDGRRSVQDIRDALSAEFGPVPLGPVVEYLKALAEIGVITR
jgi:hypothetical protein